jgi:hypothetical protein
MSSEQETLWAIKGVVSELPLAQQEACKELAEHFRESIKRAGFPVGELALSLVGAEFAAKE